MYSSCSDTSTKTQGTVPTPRQVDRLHDAGYDVVILQDGRPLESLPAGARVAF